MEGRKSPRKAKSMAYGKMVEFDFNEDEDDFVESDSSNTDDDDDDDSKIKLLKGSYNIERIVDHKTVAQLRIAMPEKKFPGFKTAVRFRVKWENWSSDTDTWEPSSNLLANTLFNHYCERHRLRKLDGKPEIPATFHPPDPRQSPQYRAQQFNFGRKIESPKKPVKVNRKSTTDNGEKKRRNSIEKQMQEAMKRTKTKAKEKSRSLPKDGNFEFKDGTYPSSSSSERSTISDGASSSSDSVFDNKNVKQGQNASTSYQNNSVLSVNDERDEIELAVRSISSKDAEDIENMIIDDTENQTVDENVLSPNQIVTKIDKRPILEQIERDVPSTSTSNIFDTLNKQVSSDDNIVNDTNMDDDVIVERRIVNIDDDIYDKSSAQLRIALSSDSDSNDESIKQLPQVPSPASDVPSTSSDDVSIDDEELEFLIESSKEVTKFDPELLPINDLGSMALLCQYLDIENMHHYSKEQSEDLSLYLSERLKHGFLCGHPSQAHKLLTEIFANTPSISERHYIFCNNFIPNVQARDGHDATLLMTMSWDRKSISCCDENDHVWCNNMKLLIEYGVDINEKTNQNWTALMVAVNKGVKCQIDVLVKNGADPSIVTSDGRTALHLAVERGADLETIQWLLFHGGDINLSAKCSYYDESNMTVLNLVGCKQFENIHTWRWLNDHSIAVDNKLSCWLMDYLKNMPNAKSYSLEKWPTGSIAPCHCWPIYNKNGFPKTRVYDFRFNHLPVMGPEHGLKAVLFIVPSYYAESDQSLLHRMNKINEKNLLPKITQVKLNGIDQKVICLSTAWLATLDCLTIGNNKLEISSDSGLDSRICTKKSLSSVMFIQPWLLKIK